MTTRIWKVVFDDNFASRQVVAKNIAEAVVVATALVKRDSVGDKEEKEYLNNPTSVDLIAESDN